MPLTSIVTIVLRLFAITWFLHGVIAIISGAREAFGSWAPAGYTALMIPLTYLVVAFLLFMWSHTVARLVTPKGESNVALGNLTQHDLYCFAFTFLGLYFVLSSFADALNWIHYAVMVNKEPDVADQQIAPGFYELTRHLVTLIAGGACLLFAPQCARKLASLQRKRESDPPSAVQ